MPIYATGKHLELYLVLAYWQNVVERSNLWGKKLLFAIYTAVTFIQGNAFFGHSHRKMSDNSKCIK